MENLELTFQAENQELTATNFTPPLFVASNTVAWIKAKFSLGTNWDCWSLGAVKAMWKFKGEVYSAVLDAEGVCTIPHEVLGEMTGEVKVNLVASSIEDDEVVERMTTYPLFALNVNKKAEVEGDNSVAITPSEYEQFVEDVQQYAQDAYDAKLDAESAQHYAEQAQEGAESAQRLAESARDDAVTAKGLAENAQRLAESAKDDAQGYAQDAEASASRIENLIPTPTEDGKILVTNDGEYEISDLVLLTELDHLYGAGNTVTRPEGESFVVDVIGSGNQLDGSSARDRMFGADVVIGDYNQVKGESVLSVIGGHYNDIDGAYAGTIFGMQNFVKVPEGGRNQVFSTVFGSNNEVMPPQGEWYNDATVFGNSLKVGKRGQTILGVYNEPINDTKAVIIGDGTSDDARHNAVVIKQEDGEYSVKLNNTEVTESELAQLQTLKQDIIDLLPTDTASGEIASFPDGANDVPMESLVAEIEPIQDLNGQSSPYPAGGGANKWDEEWEVGGLAWATGQNASNAKRIRSKNYIPVTPENTYYFKTMSGASGNLNIFYYDASKGFISYKDASVGNTTLTIPSGVYYIRFFTANDGYGTTYKNDISINYPSTDTAYHPYSNICPISGTTEVNTVRAEKNLFDKNNISVLNAYFYNGVLASGTGQRVVYIECKPNSTYTVSKVAVNSGADDRFGLAWAVDTPSINSTIYDAQTKASGFVAGTKYSFTVTTGADAKYIVVWVARSTEYDQSVPTLQIEVGSTATTYEPYVSPLTITTQLGQTVYGGTLDVVSGVLTVAEVMKDLRGAYFTDVSATLGAVRMALPSGWEPWKEQFGGSAVAFSHGIATSRAGITSVANGFFVGDTNGGNQQLLFLKLTGITEDKTTAQNYIEAQYNAGTPLQVIYAVATPITVHLTPTEVKTLLGTNNVWADSGDVEVTYKADIQKYIDKQISAVLNA